MRKTKVICTIGPSVSTEKGIDDLLESGMDVARLNFSHGEHHEHKKVIQMLHKARKNREKPLAILLDTKGPEVRSKNTAEMVLSDGEIYRLHDQEESGAIALYPGSVLKDLHQGTTVLFDDGNIKAEVIEVKDKIVNIQMKSSGVLKPNKSINFPGVSLNLPFLPDKDKEDILFGVEQKVDAIAASFAMSAEHILSIKELLREAGADHILVFSKIESLEGINNFDEILEVSDGIMVARGDLAVECSYAQVPPLQKMMIDKCNQQGKPVIVATQMLESMINNFSPTRAEVSDVANSVFDGTSATMLSGETAMGRYPNQTVSVMCEIIKEAEKDQHFRHKVITNKRCIQSKVAFSAVETANDIEASAIIAFSKSGKTARRISALRPKGKVIVVTPDDSTFYQAAFLFGAIAIKEQGDYNHQNIDQFTDLITQKKWVDYGDLIVLTMGMPFGVSYTTNTIRIESIGNPIVRGKKPSNGNASKVTGVVSFYFPRGKKKQVDYEGKIVVMRECFSECKSLLKRCRGVILQNSHYDKASEKRLEEVCQINNIPFITRADGAMSLLKEGVKVRLEASLGLVFGE